MLPFFFLLASALSTAWSSEKIQLTWIYRDVPSLPQLERVVAEWKQKTALQIRIFPVVIPLSLRWEQELPRLTSGLQKMEWIFPNLPSSSHLPLLRRLLASSVELGFQHSDPFRASEVERLQALGMNDVLLVSSTYPQSPSEVSALLALSIPFRLSYSVGRFPDYFETFSWRGLRREIPMTFRVSSWPEYIAMDHLNLIPQGPKHLEVRDLDFDPALLPYLQNIRDLRLLHFSSNGATTSRFWKSLEAMPDSVRFRYTARDRTPTQQEVESFFHSCFNRACTLVVEESRPPTEQELQRLNTSLTPLETQNTRKIEWIVSQDD